MRSLRSCAAALAAVCASVALTIAAGGGVAAAAMARPVTAAVTWHDLTLVNGWELNGSAPSYAVKDGIAYLSGSLRQPSPGSEMFATLPAAARPARALYITVYTFNGTSASLIIYPDGAMYVEAPDQANAQSYTSLATVSFPVAASARHKLVLINGWASSQHRWNTGDPSYSIRSGVVYLSGSVHKASGSKPIFAVLPKAARPASRVFVAVYTYAGSVGALLIFPDGQIQAYLGDAQKFTSLAGVSYPVASATRHSLSLMSGWKSAAHKYHTGNPAYAVKGGVVYLSGSIHQPSGSDDLVGVLPKAAWPTNTLYVQVLNAGATGSLEISTEGDIYSFNVTHPHYARLFTSLESISYPVNS